MEDFVSMITLCNQQIKELAEWVTPYYYLGIEYANTGHLIEAINSFEYFITNAPDTQTYNTPKDQARQLIKIVKLKLDK